MCPQLEQGMLVSPEAMLLTVEKKSYNFLSMWLNLNSSFCLSMSNNMRIGDIKCSFFPLKMLILMTLKPLLKAARQDTWHLLSHFIQNTSGVEKHVVSQRLFCPSEWLKQVPLSLVTCATYRVWGKSSIGNYS